jgi:glucan 1,3-beta-glucosidase
MKLICTAILFIFVLGTSAQLPEIPEVEDAAGYVLKGFEDYDGDHSETPISKRQSTAYWYEVIDHQGISAFGPSGYQVYRNVMDYGATGESQLRCVLKYNMC